MFVEGKYYAQYCYEKEESWVLVDRIDKILDDQLVVYSILIGEDYLTQESQSWSPGFDDDFYVEIDKSLFDELLSYFKNEKDYDYYNKEVSQKYIRLFKEICKGNWRTLDD